MFFGCLLSVRKSSEDSISQANYLSIPCPGVLFDLLSSWPNLLIERKERQLSVSFSAVEDYNVKEGNVEGIWSV